MERLRLRLREAAGLSPAEVARALKVATTVARWENGTSEPRGDQRAAYARLLDGRVQRYPAPLEPQVSGSESGGRASSP